MIRDRDTLASAGRAHSLISEIQGRRIQAYRQCSQAREGDRLRAVAGAIANVYCSSLCPCGGRREGHGDGALAVGRDAGSAGIHLAVSRRSADRDLYIRQGYVLIVGEGDRLSGGAAPNQYAAETDTAGRKCYRSDSRARQARGLRTVGAIIVHV